MGRNVAAVCVCVCVCVCERETERERETKDCYHLHHVETHIQSITSASQPEPLAASVLTALFFLIYIFVKKCVIVSS